MEDDAWYFPDDILEDALLILLPSKDGAAREHCGLATKRNGQILDIFRSNVLEVERQVARRNTGSGADGLADSRRGCNARATPFGYLGAKDGTSGRRRSAIGRVRR